MKKLVLSVLMVGMLVGSMPLEAVSKMRSIKCSISALHRKFKCTDEEKAAGKKWLVGASVAAAVAALAAIVMGGVAISQVKKEKEAAADEERQRQRAHKQEIGRIDPLSQLGRRDGPLLRGRRGFPTQYLKDLKEFLAKPGIDVNQKYDQGGYRSSLLYDAIESLEDLQAVEMLLKAGADPKQAGIGGMDALLGAVNKFDEARNKQEFDNIIKIIKLLKQHGSNPDAKNRNGTVREQARKALNVALSKRDHYVRSNEALEKAMTEVESALN